MATAKITYSQLDGKAQTLNIGGEMTPREFLEDVVEVSIKGVSILVNGSQVDLDEYILESGDEITMMPIKSTSGNK